MVEMEVKGTKDGILISLDAQEWPQARKNLIGHIDENQAFFEGALKDHPLPEEEIKQALEEG